MKTSASISFPGRTCKVVVDGDRENAQTHTDSASISFEHGFEVFDANPAAEDGRNVEKQPGYFDPGGGGE